jgi:hypothetical protein
MGMEGVINNYMDIMDGNGGSDQELYGYYRWEGGTIYNLNKYYGWE